MTGSWRHPRKLLDDGTVNPLWKPHGVDARKRHDTGDTRERKGGPSYRMWENGQFCAWDGESVGRGITAPQQYRVFVGWSQEDHVSITVNDGFDALKCLTDFSAAHHHLIHVGFGFQYDVDMMLSTVADFDQLVRLWNGETVKVKVPESREFYELSVVPRKSFTIQRYSGLWKRGKKGWEADRIASLTVYDTFGFFQSSFVQALEDNIPWCPLLPLIRQGKKYRTEFDEADSEFMVRYSLAECEALVHLMDWLRDQLRSIDLPIQRWDGAGAIAAAMMRKEHVVKEIEPIEDARLWKALKSAYKGGWIELMQFGHTDATVYAHDINSAYPAAMLDLPSLRDGSWYHAGAPQAEGKFDDYDDVTGKSEAELKFMQQLVLQPEKFSPLTLVSVKWRFPKGLPFYPFSYRDQFGSIWHPPAGRGWVYLCELQAAGLWIEAMKKAYSGDISGVDIMLEINDDPLGSKLAIFEAWTFLPVNDVLPFEFVRDRYAERAKFKAENNGAQLPLKLGLNSLYGKLIQSVGGGRDREEEHRAKSQGRKALRTMPNTFCLPYAGYITARTRARLLELASKRPKSIIAFATDGVYATEKLTKKTSKAIGEWGVTEYNGASFVQAGVYFLNTGGSITEHYRGFDRKSLDESRVRAAWNVAFHSECGPIDVDVSVSRHIGIGSATRSVDSYKRFCWWPSESRALSTWPDQHRDTKFPLERNPAQELVPTTARPFREMFVGVPAMSHPYAVSWLNDPERLAGMELNGVPQKIWEAEAEDSKL